MVELVRRITLTGPDGTDPEQLTREWLVTNGLGGYASGTLSGAVTRRYHGLLIAALPAPLSRTVMLSEISEQFKCADGNVFQLGGLERNTAGPQLHPMRYLHEFRLEMGLPVWTYKIGEIVIERRLFMPHLQNTTYLSYKLLEGAESVVLRLRPALHFRPHDAPVSTKLLDRYVLAAHGDRYEVKGDSHFPVLRLYMADAPFTVAPGREIEVLYPIEESRGYDFRGELWVPGHFTVEIKRGETATLLASTEPWEVALALSGEEAHSSELRRRRRLLRSAPAQLREGAAGELLLAADQFIITPVGRPAAAARAHAAGDEIRTVLAGYHWFTDWGRDTMISLEGLTLTSGRYAEASWILRTFAYYVRDGLIPNLFPEGGAGGLYHTADASLWFFHALDRYIEITGDRDILITMLPKLLDIFEHHLRGTKFNIGVDPKDGLLRQGAPGYQLTWMDAKVGDWVVTPRRGKAVEINALWYNALRLLQCWVEQERGSQPAARIRDAADRVLQAFNSRFWYSDDGYLYDVVDGENGKDDPACRPNQILAFSLKYPVLDESRWPSVLEVVRERLLTPVGLRSLAPEHPDYKKKYFGGLRTRDAAYHQGTVWAWLIGPFIDAWLRVHPHERADARKFLDGLLEELGNGGVGSINEVFDAEPPFAPRGCIAQAWSIAEVLRCLAKLETAGEQG